MHDHYKKKAQLIEEINDLRQSEERFRTIVTSMDEFIFTLDNNQRFTSIYGNFIDRLQVGVEFFIGRSVAEVLGEESGLDYETMYQQVLAGETVTFESNYTIAGEKVYFQTVLTPLVGDDDELYGLVGVGRDITQTKLTEMALRESETKLRTLFDLLPVGVGLLNADRKLEEFNKSLGRILAIDNEGFANGRFAQRQFLRPDGTTRPFHEFPSTRAAEEKEPVYNVEIGVVIEDGETVWTEVSAAPLPDDRVVVVTNDITKRRQAEDALRESEERLRLATTAGRVGIWDWHITEGRLIWDENMYALYGLRAEDHPVPNEAWTKALHPDDLPSVTTQLEAILEGVQEDALEYRILLPDGRVRTVLSAYKLTRNEQGQIVRLIGTSIDITERKEREKQELEDQRLRSLGLLAGGIAHDINNLLTPIKINMDMLRIIYSGNQEGLGYLDMVDTAAHKIEAIVQEMLVFAGKRKPRLGAMDLNALISDLSTLLHHSLPKNSNIQLNLTNKPLPMQGDRAQMEQVVMNLILNASDALEGQPGQILVSTCREGSGNGGDQAKLIIQDNGSGILPEHLDQIYDPFFTTKVTGRGLGLSAVRGIVQSHNGEIDVVSVVGKGTTFTIILPLAPKVLRTETIEAAASGNNAPLEGIWLVVEDEELLRDSTTKVMQALGVKTLEASDGAEGLWMVNENAAVLTGVLLDISMPIMDGQEVFKLIRATFPDLPVILTSGYSHMEVKDFLTQPRVAFLPKPFKFNELREMMISVVK